MYRVVLTGATIARTSFVKAVLQSSQLDGVVGSNIDFSEARLAAVNFTGSELTAVKFVGADLRAANFSNATLIDVDFTGAILSSEYHYPSFY